MVLGQQARVGISLCILAALAACEESGSKQGPVDSEAPSIGAAISFSAIAATSATVTWGAADDAWTDAGRLRYKLVRAADASDIDTLAEVEAITDGPGLVRGYTRGLTSSEASGLAAATPYAFAVAVQDDTGNKALYAPATLTTLDATAPTPGADISFADVTANTLTLSWGAASDDVTPAAALQYKVVMATMLSAIDTLAEVDAITGSGLVQDFSTGLTTQAVTGLSSSVAYAFAVVVRDAQGNEALYTPETVSTPDATPPAPGSAITFSNIAANSLVISWGFATDAVTGPFSLKYKLVKASDAAAIDTVEEADAITGDGVVTDYTVGLLQVAEIGFASSTSYAFAVVVKDAAGNRALYAPAVVRTLDASAPVPGSALSASSVATTGLSLSWGAATDNLSPQSALQYKLVKASSAAAIDTLEEVALITTGSGLVQDFTTALLTKAVTGLTSSTEYAFSVVVKDEQGNLAIYTPLTQATLDDTTPIPGSALSFASVAATSLTVNWGEATDNVSTEAQLQYKLVRALSSTSIDTIAEIDAITTAPGLVMDFTADVATRNVTGLSPSVSYAFALLVRDAAGNKALYAPATVVTPDTSAPSVGAALSFTNVTSSDITVVWGAASDDVTPPGSLVYKAVTGAGVASIDTLAEIDAITAAPGLLADYTANLTTVTASGLSASRVYAFAVVVRDAAGNRALYTAALRSTLDVSPPVMGSPISFNGVTDTTLNIDWGAATDDVTSGADLQYKVVSAASASDIDTLAEVAAITSGGALIQDFTADSTTAAVSGLTSSTTYAFAVVVRDAAGNESLYTPDVITTFHVSAPTPGLALSFSSIAATSLTVSWGAATDDVTAATSLTYKLVRGASPADIDSLAEVAAISAGPDLIVDFTANLTSAPATGLSSSTSYAFAVVVSDGAGNLALYSPAIQATLDVTDPTLGTAISFSNVAATSLTVNWGAAADNISAAADLQYKVVSAASASDIDTLGEVAAITSGPGLVQNYTANITTLPVAGLSSATSYAFGVVVRDEAGNEALYAPDTTTTP